jgi:uncharacterized protein DUF6599
MFQNWFRSGLLLLVLISSVQAQEQDPLIQAVNNLPGWTSTGKAATFNESNIEQFDKKLAPGLLTFGIKDVSVQAWQSPAGQIRATLFRLSDPGAAYGFFTNRRRIEGGTADGLSAAAESFQNRTSYYFWQASYVIRFEGDAKSVETAAMVLSRNIPGRSQRPSLMNHLPTSNLIAGSEEYILAASEIEKVEGVDASELGFDSSAEAASANYRINGRTVRLLLVLYPTQQIAKKVSDQINGASPKFSESRKRIGPVLAIVSNTTDMSIVQSLLEQVHYSSSVTWNEPQPGLGLGPIIITVFTFIGLLLGICITAGFGLGGARLMMKTFFPNRAFDRREDVGIIQLKLDQQLTRKEIGE